MLNRREVIERILAVRPDLSIDDLQRIIETKMEGAGRLLTEEGATFMVANELGIDLSNGKVVDTGLKVKDLIIGANDATIAGVVTAMSPPRTFVRRDGVEGQVARLVVADDTGSVRVVLWNEKTNSISQGRVALNQMVRISHGYVRAGLTGEPELNVGRRGTLVVLASSPSVERELPQNFQKKIHDLTEDDAFVTIVGVVKGTSPVSTFQRRTGIQGQVMRVRLADETGRITAVLWDDQVDAVADTGWGDIVEIEGGQVRRGLGNVLEVHVGRLGHIKRLQDAKLAAYSAPTVTKISDLRLGMNDVDVLGRITEVGPIREFTRRSGDVGRVGSVYVMDETGVTRLTLWNDKADVIEGVSVDDVVLAEGGYTREGLGGVVELNLGSMGTVTVNPDREDARRLPHFSTDAMAIGNLNVGMRNVTVKGNIVDDPTVRDVTTRDGVELRVASLRIQDDSGEITVTLWRDLADRVRDVGAGTRLHIKNAYVKMGFFGDLELSSGMATELEVMSGETRMPEGGGVLINDATMEMAQAPQTKASTEVRGQIVEINTNSKVYPSCPNCMKRVREEATGWVCDSCGEVPQHVPRLIVEAVAEADEGRVTCVFSGAVAEDLLDMSSDSAWNMALQAGSEGAPVEHARDQLIGATVELAGRVRRRRRDGSMRLYVERLIMR